MRVIEKQLEKQVEKGSNRLKRGRFHALPHCVRFPIPLSIIPLPSPVFAIAFMPLLNGALPGVGSGF
jgi:hypothetical protein